MKKAVNGEEMNVPRMPKSIDLSQMTRAELEADFDTALAQIERGDGIHEEEAWKIMDGWFKKDEI